MTYDERTALIVVDVQNDFADPDGSLYVDGGADVVAVINDQIAAAQTAGATIVYTQDWHPESTPHFDKDGGIWPVHCVADSWGAELHPELNVVEEAERIQKGAHGEDGYSGFSMRNPLDPEDRSSTGLHETLADRGVERLVVVGLATDYCVKETALDGSRLGYETIVLDAAIRAVDLSPGDGDAAKTAMVASGVRIA
jgi:nicotinamidase/pyrazinamidase